MTGLPPFGEQGRSPVLLCSAYMAFHGPGFGPRLPALPFALQTLPTGSCKALGFIHGHPWVLDSRGWPHVLPLLLPLAQVTAAVALGRPTDAADDVMASGEAQKRMNGTRMSRYKGIVYCTSLDALLSLQPSCALMPQPTPICVRWSPRGWPWRTRMPSSSQRRSRECRPRPAWLCGDLRWRMMRAWTHGQGPVLRMKSTMLYPKRTACLPACLCFAHPSLTCPTTLAPSSTGHALPHRPQLTQSRRSLPPQPRPRRPPRGPRAPPGLPGSHPRERQPGSRRRRQRGRRQWRGRGGPRRQSDKPA